MRILYWSELFWPTIGGVQVLASHWMPALQRRGYEFTVVTSFGDRDLPSTGEYNGTPIYRFPFLKALAARDVVLISELVHQVAAVKRSVRPDVILVDFSDPSLFFHLRSARESPAPWLLEIFQGLSVLSSGGADTLIGQALRSADWVVACSAAALADARLLAPEITPRSSVMYAGRQLPDLVPTPLPRDPVRLLCLGRVVADKGFDTALSAFGLLAERYPQARLVIAGDGPARPGLEEQAAALGVAHAVEFLGWVNPKSVPQLINEATVVVVPSRWVQEGLPVVSMEAAQMGRPVVATRVGGLPESVVDHVTGLLVEREDHQSLADAIAYLLDCPEVAAQMGQAGRQRVQELFGLEQYVDGFDSIYQRLGTGKTSHSRSAHFPVGGVGEAAV